LWPFHATELHWGIMVSPVSNSLWAVLGVQFREWRGGSHHEEAAGRVAAGVETDLMTGLWSCLIADSLFIRRALEAESQ
jgi:hypothetical protein